MIETMKNLKVSVLTVGYDYYKIAEEKAKKTSSKEEDKFVRENFYKSTKEIQKAILNWNPVVVNTKEEQLPKEQHATTEVAKKESYNDIVKKVKEKAKQFGDGVIADTCESIIKEFSDQYPELKYIFNKAIDKDKIKQLVKSSEGDKEKCIEIITDTLLSMIPDTKEEDKVIDVEAEEIVSLPDNQKSLSGPLQMIENLQDAKNAVIMAYPDRDDIEEEFQQLCEIFEKEIFTAIQLGKISKSQTIIVNPITNHQWELVAVVDSTPGYHRRSIAIRVDIDNEGKVSSRYYDRINNVA